ncbi:MAG TPA: cell surface protein SprA, partial [Bacteroidales bacterium]|nr:cell surface protein SprA [Bacteroidales bacterium]
EYIPNDNQSQTSFDISTVSIEENGERVPVPYVLPPEIEREINLGTTNLQRLNEQSMVVKVCNLQDGDARAAYKTADFDFRQYKKLQMFIHAEKAPGGLNDDGSTLYRDGELSLFVRIGSDFDQNFYEYEIPLEFTDWYDKDQNDIWPENNNMEIVLDKLVNAKQERNQALRDPNSVLTLSTPFTINDGNRTITVVGSPSLSDVRAIMIGIRNPKRTFFTSADDDGEAKCAEVWVNELRLTDFDESSGWAATARVNTMLADLGNLVISGMHSTPGWGSIEKKVNERAKETTTQFDLATNLELGKFFPAEAGLRIPMHFDYSQTRISPEYNPLDPDIRLKEDLKESYDTPAERDSIRSMTQDLTRRKNLNFVNVRKEKVGGSTKNRVYDVENFDFTYAYSELYHRNVDIEYDRKETHRGGIGYNFTNNPKNIRPFSRSKLLGKGQALRIIRDFNFFYAPKLLSFRTDVNREYSERLLRNKSQAKVILEPTYLKKFEWRRVYDVKYDLTQALRVDFQANANAYIDEPPGRIDKDDPDYELKRDTIWQEVMKGGSMQNYNQNLQVNYNLPINKLPLLSFINASVRYDADYRWTASARSVHS